MKKSFLLALAAFMLASCAEQTALRHPDWAYDATIYGGWTLSALTVSAVTWQEKCRPIFGIGL